MFLPSSKYCFPYFKRLIRWAQCKVRWYTLWKTMKLQTTETSIMNQFSLCQNFPKGFPLGLKFSKLHFSSKPNHLIHLNLERIQLNFSAEYVGASRGRLQRSLSPLIPQPVSRTHNAPVLSIFLHVVRVCLWFLQWGWGGSWRIKRSLPTLNTLLVSHHCGLHKTLELEQWKLSGIYESEPKTMSNGGCTEPDPAISHKQARFFQWRDWDANSATKPLTYNLCLQDVLG